MKGEAMGIFIVHGAKITVPEACGCGSIPRHSELADHVWRWGKLADICSFCGSPIRFLGGPIEHVHAAPKEPDAWAVQHPEWEDSFTWYGTGPWGATDIRAHTACARKATPFAPWDVEIGAGDRAVPPDAFYPKAEVLSPCGDCGAEASEADARAVTARMYTLWPPPVCAYCGGTIRLEAITVWHRTLAGRHAGAWHWKDWAWEAFHDWYAYRVQVRGHLRCARRALLHARWEAPRPALGATGIIK
jgi:hypothetical protein